MYTGTVHSTISTISNSGSAQTAGHDGSGWKAAAVRRASSWTWLSLSYRRNSPIRQRIQDVSTARRYADPEHEVIIMAALLIEAKFEE